MSLRSELVSDPFGESFLREWETLQNSSYPHSIYQKPEWNKAWWVNFSESTDQLCVHAIYQNEKLLAIAPLYLSTSRVNGISENTLQFIGSSNFASDYCAFILSEECLKEDLLKSVFSDSRWSLLRLSNMLLSDTELLALRNILYERFSKRILVESPYKAHSFVDSASSRYSNLLKKKSLKRAFNKLSKAGSLNFQRVIDRKVALELLPIFFEQHIARRQAVGDESQFKDKRQRAFYTDIINSLDLVRDLHFSVLHLSHSPIAFHLGFLSNNKLLWYKPSFDPQLSELSPGKVLLRFLIQEAQQLSLEELDFTVGDEEFKRNFTNISREIYSINVYRSSVSYYMQSSRNLASRLRKILR